jgi:nucleoside-diphosphate-sugar epimerase
MRVVGSGRNVAPVVYGEDVAECAVRAAGCEAAAGETFNISSGERVTWEDFLSTLARYLGATLPTTHIPAPLLYPAAAILEGVWKLAGAAQPPPATRFGVRLLASDWWVDVSKADKVLGFRPQTGYREGLRKTVDWLESQPGSQPQTAPRGAGDSRGE